MSPGVVFEEPGFSGSLSGLSRQKAAHVDPGVTCRAATSGRRQVDNNNKITNGVMLGQDDGRDWTGMKKRTTGLTTSPAWHKVDADQNRGGRVCSQGSVQSRVNHTNTPVKGRIHSKESNRTSEEELSRLYFNPARPLTGRHQDTPTPWQQRD